MNERGIDDDSGRAVQRIEVSVEGSHQDVLPADRGGHVVDASADLRVPDYVEIRIHAVDVPVRRTEVQHSRIVDDRSAPGAVHHARQGVVPRLGDIDGDHFGIIRTGTCQRDPVQLALGRGKEVVPSDDYSGRCLVTCALAVLEMPLLLARETVEAVESGVRLG